VFDFSEYPRVADGSPADHEGVGLVGVVEVIGGGGVEDVAIADDGDGDGGVGFEAADPLPAGGACVAVGLGAGMNGERGYPHGLEAVRHLHDANRAGIPSQACLDRHGEGSSFYDVAGEIRHAVNVPQDTGTSPFADNFADGAAVVDVQPVGLHGLNELGCLSHGIFVMPENLNTNGTFGLAKLGFMPAFGDVADEPFTGDELGDDGIGAHVSAQAPEGRIANVLHRRQKERRDIAFADHNGPNTHFTKIRGQGCSVRDELRNAWGSRPR